MIGLTARERLKANRVASVRLDAMVLGDVYGLAHDALVVARKRDIGKESTNPLADTTRALQRGEKESTKDGCPICGDRYCSSQAPGPDSWAPCPQLPRCHDCQKAIEPGSPGGLCEDCRP